MTDLVSILIPVFNRQSLIAETIQSALQQTYKNIEVVVVDNASTDRTWEVVQKIAPRDDRVKCFRNEENIGPVRNWKRCIDEATGKYGKILWSDDLIASDFIQETLPFLANDDEIGFVYTKVAIFDDADNKDFECYHLDKTGIYDSEQYIQGVIVDYEYPVSPGCAIFRLEDLREHLLIDIPNKKGSDFSMHAIGNDLLIFLLTANKYRKFAYVDEKLSFFRSHDGSISARAKKDNLKIHYALAAAYFIEHYRPDLISRLNVAIKMKLMRFHDSKEYGLATISDFYMSNTNFRFKTTSLIHEILKELSRKSITCILKNLAIKK
jgi:glycosyltransferase involved in cell wall biosynthesis